MGTQIVQADRAVEIETAGMLTQMAGTHQLLGQLQRQCQTPILRIQTSRVRRSITAPVLPTMTTFPTTEP